MVLGPWWALVPKSAGAEVPWVRSSPATVARPMGQCKHPQTPEQRGRKAREGKRQDSPLGQQTSPRGWNQSRSPSGRESWSCQGIAIPKSVTHWLFYRAEYWLREPSHRPEARAESTTPLAQSTNCQVRGSVQCRPACTLTALGCWGFHHIIYNRRASMLPGDGAAGWTAQWKPMPGRH